MPIWVVSLYSGARTAYNSNNSESVTFPTSFPNNVFTVSLTLYDVGGGSGGNTVPKLSTSSTTGFTYGGTGVFSNDNITKVKWIAIGN